MMNCFELINAIGKKGNYVYYNVVIDHLFNARAIFDLQLLS